MGIKCVSEKFLCRVVRFYLEPGTVGLRAAKHLPQKWRFDSKFGIQVWFLSESAFERLDDLMKRGLDSGQIRLEYFFAFEMFGHLFGVNHNYSFFNVWSKSTVEGLAARGFPVDCDSIPVIEDRFISE